MEAVCTVDKNLNCSTSYHIYDLEQIMSLCFVSSSVRRNSIGTYLKGYRGLTYIVIMIKASIARHYPVLVNFMSIWLGHGVLGQTILNVSVRVFWKRLTFELIDYAKQIVLPNVRWASSNHFEGLNKTKKWLTPWRVRRNFFLLIVMSWDTSFFLPSDSD